MVLKRRPLSVTILASVVLCFSAWNILRLGASLANWDLLTTYLDPPWPYYLVSTGAIWSLSGLASFPGIWFGKKWAWHVCLAMIIIYASWYWIDRLFVQIQAGHWAFALVITLLLLIVLVILLFSRNSLRYFQSEAHEQTTENPTAS